MKKVFQSIIVFAAIASLAGCKKDFTIQPPQDKLTAAVFYQSKDELLSATAPLYNIVWFEYNDKGSIGIGDARAGNMQSNDYAAFYRFSVPSTDPFTLLTAYKAFYKTVAQANILMSNLNSHARNVSAQDLNAAVAEARFMRGLAYSHLVKYWGPVPIIYDNVSQLKNGASIQRNTIEDVWKFIIMDLRYASENLPVVATQNGRLTKYSAEGMLAKMYLTRAGVGVTGGNRRQSDLDSARFYAADVIKNGPFVLEPNYADLFKSANHSGGSNNPESLFSLQWVPSSQTWGTNNTFQAYMAKDGTITGSWDGWGAAHGASADLIKYYLKDPKNPQDSLRRKATFMFDGDHYPEINKKAGGYKYTSDGIANVKKYIIGSPADNGGKGVEMAENINSYMMRLAEVYLIYAEAILGNATSTSDSEALKYFNLVRARAGMPDKASITFDDIFQEKRIETAMEGVAWGEYIRLYYFNPEKAKQMIAAQDKGAYTVKYITGTQNPRQYDVTYTPEHFSPSEGSIYLPIPESEMVKSPGLSKPPIPFDFGQLK